VEGSRFVEVTELFSMCPIFQAAQNTEVYSASIQMSIKNLCVCKSLPACKVENLTSSLSRFYKHCEMLDIKQTCRPLLLRGEILRKFV
jgi:hypothetical protein